LFSLQKVCFVKIYGWFGPKCNSWFGHKCKFIALLPYVFAHSRQNSPTWVNSRMCIFNVS